MKCKKIQNIDIANHLLEPVEFVPSENCDDRPDEQDISLVVIHNISLPPGVFEGDAVKRLFTNTLEADAHPYFREIHHLKVSAHLFIRRAGEIIQFVPFHRRAWHAGVSCWCGRTACNDFSIGIELEGMDEVPYAEAQYAALRTVLKLLKKHYPLRAVAGHADIAPGRKTDPGPAFDWSRITDLLPRVF